MILLTGAVILERSTWRARSGGRGPGQARDRRRDIPIIVLSPALGNDAGQRFFDLGAEASAAKPIDVAAFLAEVDRILEGGVAHA